MQYLYLVSYHNKQINKSFEVGGVIGKIYSILSDYTKCEMCYFLVKRLVFLVLPHNAGMKSNLNIHMHSFSNIKCPSNVVFTNPFLIPSNM